MQIKLSACIAFASLIFGNSSWSKALDWPYTLDDGKLVMINATRKEIAYTKASLTKITDRNIPENLEGAVLFDCQVIRRLPSDRYGQKAWLVAPNHIFAGFDQIANGYTKLTSPTIKNGGLIIEVGKRYRVLAVDFARLDSGKKGELYIWAGSVSKLNSGTSRANRKFFKTLQ
jgi:hypothetical protein